MRKWLTIPIGVVLVIAAYLYQRHGDSERVLAVALQIPAEIQISPTDRDLINHVIAEVHPAAMDAARGDGGAGSRWDPEKYKTRLFAEVGDRLRRRKKDNLADLWLEQEAAVSFTVQGPH